MAALVTTHTPCGGLGLVLPRAILCIGAGIYTVPGHQAWLPAGRHQVASIDHFLVSVLLCLLEGSVWEQPVSHASADPPVSTGLLSFHKAREVSPQSREEGR